MLLIRNSFQHNGSESFGAKPKTLNPKSYTPSRLPFLKLRQLYNTENFFGRDENVFGATIVSSNIVCLVAGLHVSLNPKH
jgi:hypothetical protein